MEEKDADWRPMPGRLGGGLFEGFAIRGQELVLQTSFAALFQAEVEFESVTAWAATQVDAHAPTNQPASKPADEPRVPLAPPVSAKPAETARETPLPEPIASPASQPGVRSRLNVERRAPRGVPHTRSLTTPITAPPRAVARRTVPQETLQDLTPAPGSNVSVIERKGFSRRYAAAAAGVALAAVVAILHALFPGAEREAPPAPNARIAASSVPEPAPAPKPAPASEAAPRPDPVPAVKRAEARIHVVARGDTLWDIAKKHVGDPLQYPQLAKQSNLRDPHLIHPGDRVRIEIQEKK